MSVESWRVAGRAVGRANDIDDSIRIPEVGNVHLERGATLAEGPEAVVGEQTVQEAVRKIRSLPLVHSCVVGEEVAARVVAQAAAGKKAWTFGPRPDEERGNGA